MSDSISKQVADAFESSPDSPKGKLATAETVIDWLLSLPFAKDHLISAGLSNDNPRLKDNVAIVVLFDDMSVWATSKDGLDDDVFNEMADEMRMQSAIRILQRMQRAGADMGPQGDNDFDFNEMGELGSEHPINRPRTLH